jgi:imidazolonepropionase-like amidohydrolase
MYKILFFLILGGLGIVEICQAQDNYYLLLPDRIFDGEQMHENWGVLVKNDKIAQIGIKTQFNIPPQQIIDLKGMTLLPGLIEGHSHLFLHPYNETSWNDQVLKESKALRTIRATVHAKSTLLAGFTTVRDLGTEGADYEDVALKQAIEEGIIPGPRMLVATRAIVATGSYGPKGFALEWKVPQGAEEADGIDNLIKAVRSQIGKGADIIKVYADYRWGINGEVQPTFSIDELTLMVTTARSSGRPTVAHAMHSEAMRRAVLAGVETIEHGDDGNVEVFQLMAQKGVALCPTLAAGDAISQYRGWRKGTDSEPDRIKLKKISFQNALKAGVKICFGGDVGVFAHGDNAREMELMVEYGMKPIDVLKSATSVNADVFHIADKVGRIKVGLFADLIAVKGNPGQNIQNIRQVALVMKNGKIIVSN